MNNLKITNNASTWFKNNKCRLVAFALSITAIATSSGCGFMNTFTSRESNYDAEKSDNYFNKTILLLDSRLKTNGYFIDEDELKIEYEKLIAENRNATIDELYSQLIIIFEDQKENNKAQDSLDVNVQIDTSIGDSSVIESDSSNKDITLDSNLNQELPLEPNLNDLAYQVKIDNETKGTICDEDSIVSSIKIINYDNLNIMVDENELSYLMQGFNNYCSLVYSNNLNGNNHEFITLNDLCFNQNDQIIIENLENKMQTLATNELTKEDYNELFNDFYEFYSSDDFNEMTVGAGLLSDQIGNCSLRLFINNKNYDAETAKRIDEFLMPKKDGTCNLDGSKYFVEIFNKNNKAKVYCK